jgi:hypothetical protein
MNLQKLAFAAFILSTTALGACSQNDGAATNVAGPVSTPPPACTEGASRCDGDQVATCSDGAFTAPVACEGESVCRDGACRAPSAKQLAQAEELAAMLRYLKDETAWPLPIDWEKLRIDGRKSILGSDGSDLAYVTSLYRAFIAVPEGHQTFFLDKGCGDLIATLNTSLRGACGQPHSRGIVVTNATATNPLGLKKGDLVTRVGDASGSSLLTKLAERPICTASHPSTSNRDAVTAASFTDLLVAGEEIEIESPDGLKRTIKMPDVPLHDTSVKGALFCEDPFSRKQVPAESELRPDGIGVIRLPGFTDPEQTFPTDGTEASFQAYRDKFEAKIQAAFDKVKSAPAIIWDIRGNGGGLTLVGLEIASGFPGARADALSYCEARTSGSDPPAFAPERYAEYALTPGGRFAYSGKVAVLIDGQDYSAADYFPLAVKTRTNATLVGAPTAGAFGATSADKSFAGPPGFTISVDQNRCSSAVDDTPLEGKNTTPHVAVEYDPKDLAAGRDTVLEKAAELLK